MSQKENKLIWYQYFQFFRHKNAHLRSCNVCSFPLQMCRILALTMRLIGLGYLSNEMKLKISVLVYT